jgi:phospholipid/cholesterol/gamma-HCH transport system ATP-binding protein
VEGLTLAYGSGVVLRDVSFAVDRGDLYIIMGVNGSGKSTLLKSMIGLKPPVRGRVLYDGVSFWDADEQGRRGILRRIGILYQKNALWSSMTLAENVGLPIQEYTALREGEISQIVSFKLSLVGLKGFEGYRPAELSGGMQKRAALARAMALDPEILFFDEPSSGLDPVNAGLLDDLILDLNRIMGTTIVIISHDLDSILSIGRTAIFLDPEAKTIIARGNPKELLKESTDPKVRTFLTRGHTGRHSEGA